MKGVINKGVQELIEERFGQDAWDAIRAAAGNDEPSFSPSLDYPDQMTIDLVMAAAQQLNMSPDQVMIEFGKYWVTNTGKATYPTLYALAGDNARVFLTRIDRIHSQVTASVTGAHPPRLKAENLPEGDMRLHYGSQRRLCPVVHGLILGVGEYFSQDLSVNELNCMRRGDAECVFEVSFA